MAAVASVVTRPRLEDTSRARSGSDRRENSCRLYSYRSRWRYEAMFDDVWNWE